MINYYITPLNNFVFKITTKEDGSSEHRMLIQDPNNTDYQQYLAWLEEGNKPMENT
jgi:hypothetical protein